MDNNINITPNPIQRNQRDVALELTKMYLDRFSVDSLEEMQEVYSKFYAVCVNIEIKNLKRTSALRDLVSEKVR